MCILPSNRSGSAAGGAVSLAQWIFVTVGGLVVLSGLTMLVFGIGSKGDGSTEIWTIKASGPAGIVVVLVGGAFIAAAFVVPAFRPPAAAASAASPVPRSIHGTACVDSDQMLDLYATYDRIWPLHHVYISTDANVKTGYKVIGVGGPPDGLGADYLIEEGHLFPYSASARPVWPWGEQIPGANPLQAQPGVGAVPVTYHWRVPLSDLGTPSAVSVVFAGGPYAHTDTFSDVVASSTGKCPAN
jgi:hypothetical protein